MDLASGALIFVVTIGGLLDVQMGKIPNVLTYPSWVVGFVLALGLGGVGGLGNAVLGFAVGFVPLFLLYLRGGMGGGDVKLMAGVGALMGYPFVVNALVSTILVGGLLAFLIVLWEGQIWNTIKFVGQSLWRVFNPHLQPIAPVTKRVLPFGAAITLGCYATLIAERLGYASPADFLL